MSQNQHNLLTVDSFSFIYNIDQNMLHYILIEEIETFIELNPIAISDFLDILSFIQTVP